MKILLLPILGFLLLVSACKKEYTCTCTYSDGNGNSKSDTYDQGKQSKDDAKKLCEEQVTVLEAAGGKNVECTSSAGNFDS